MPAARHWFRLAWVAAALCALGTLPWLVTATSAGGWSLHAQAVAVAGVAFAAFVVLTGQPAWARLLAFLPFSAAALGFFQYRDKT